MKNLFITFAFILLLCSFSVYPHPQKVHQYIVKEAYELLLTHWGNIIPEMDDHIGGLDPFYRGDYAWQIPYITTGSWREDEEDPVFNYDIIEIQGVNIALVSITHFWDADDGDLNLNSFPIIINRIHLFDLEFYENAFDKMLRYKNGEWVLWFPDIIYSTNTANNHRLIITPEIVIPPNRFGISLDYTSLTAFYNNPLMSLLSDQNGHFIVFDSTAQQFISPESVSEILVDEYVKDRIVWEILGRMSHLLADMSVPAHTHRDEHGILADSFENWMGGTAEPYLEWNHQNAGELINPYTDDNDPLHYLIYITQQQADHFGSNGPGEIGNGNDVIGGEPRPEEFNFLNSLNLSSYGEPTTFNGPWNEENLINIRDKTFPYIIRATAGLLFWFALETMLITNIEENLYDIQLNEYSLLQNYPNPFNPSTIISWQSPVGSWQNLKVYDVLGNEIATLVDEEKPAGNYKVEWNAAGFPSGVYFYQLKTVPNGRQAEGYVETKKMLLLK